MCSNWASMPRKKPKTFVGKSDGAINHSRETRWFKKFCSCYMKVYDHAKSGWPKTVDYDAVVYSMSAYPASNTRRVSGKFCFSQWGSSSSQLQ